MTNVTKFMCHFTRELPSFLIVYLWRCHTISSDRSEVSQGVVRCGSKHRSLCRARAGPQLATSNAIERK